MDIGGSMKRVFSGVQPTGQIHLGNYVTMKRFVEQQADKDCLYCVVDMHSITVPQDPISLRERTLELAALYIAIGLDPQRVTLFVQSQVPAHAELAWILNCFSYVGELNRMTQFKEKSSKQGKAITTGLFTYPVLMAADILLYDTDLVPVGEDQKQHLEITRDIALRFNNRFGDHFVVPEPMIADVSEGARIMSLDDPAQKMSKSNPNPLSKITLLDDANQIKKAIMRATTDSDSTVAYDLEHKPGVSNLLTIYAQLSGKSIQAIEAEYAGKGYGALKKDLVEVVMNCITPIQVEHARILQSGEIHDILKLGRERALEKSAPVLARIQEAVGFYKSNL